MSKLSSDWNIELTFSYYAFRYDKYKDKNDKNNALLWLEKVADYYNVNLKKKVVKLSLYDALIMFLKNDKGMDENLNRIYSILKQ